MSIFFPHRLRKHDVPTIGESALGKGEVGVAAHDDGMARGEGLETLQVVGQPINQLVLITDGPVLRHRSNNTNHIFYLLRQLGYLLTTTMTT